MSNKTFRKSKGNLTNCQKSWGCMLSVSKTFEILLPTRDERTFISQTHPLDTLLRGHLCINPRSSENVVYHHQRAWAKIAPKAAITRSRPREWYGLWGKVKARKRDGQ